ncbi:MAG: hypothetical protein V2A56_07045 [bacterium]
MQIDPKLERLTALIEQKRAQQHLDSTPTAVGRSGNPRFADASRRVQLAREGRWTPNQAQHIQQDKKTDLARLASLRSATHMQALSSSRAAQESDLLTTVQSAGHLYTEGTPRPLSASAPHLGRNFDTYA